MNRRLPAIFFVLFALTFAAYGQGTVTVYDPIRAAPEENFSTPIVAAVERAAAAAGKSIPAETCERELQISGTAAGAFTRAGARQTLAFYQYCQTGNGFGWAGLVLLEGDKIVGNYISDAAWTNGIGSVADINENGLNEFVLAYSGGMHQGQGGTGVDVMEFVRGIPKPIGWYKAEEYTADDKASAWILTAKPGAIPEFFTQKHSSAGAGKYKAVGRAVPAKLGKAVSKFTTVK